MAKRNSPEHQHPRFGYLAERHNNPKDPRQRSTYDTLMMQAASGMIPHAADELQRQVAQQQADARTQAASEPNDPELDAAEQEMQERGHRFRERRPSQQGKTPSAYDRRMLHIEE